MSATPISGKEAPNMANCPPELIPIGRYPHYGYRHSSVPMYIIEQGR